MKTAPPHKAQRLVGKLVRYIVPIYDRRGGHHPPGEYRGRVVSVNAGPRKGFRSCRVARCSNPDASTLKQRYNADTTLVRAEWLTAVKHRSMKTIEEFLA